MPTYESGHARNVQRFEEMISFITSWGAAYAPSNPAISLAQLNLRLAAVTTLMDDVIANLTASKLAINNRETEYEGLRVLVTRIVNFYASTGTNANNLDDTQSLKRKIDGKRQKAIEIDPNIPENERAKTISASQQSYTQLAEHFGALIQLVGADPLYAPNEVDLEITTLGTKLGAMQVANTNVMTAYTGVSNARVARDAALYEAGSGIVELAALVKKYVKAAFGTSSSQFQQIKGLQFRRPAK